MFQNWIMFETKVSDSPFPWNFSFMLMEQRFPRMKLLFHALELSETKVSAAGFSILVIDIKK